MKKTPVLPAVLIIAAGILAPHLVEAINPTEQWAGIQARRYAGYLGFDLPVHVLVQERMPANGILAYTTRWLEPGCILHFTPETVRRSDVIAHEVCHCFFDYDLLNLEGYVSSVSRTSVSWYEARANKCERWLTDTKLSTEMERRTGNIPADIMTGRTR